MLVALESNLESLIHGIKLTWISETSEINSPFSQIVFTQMFQEHFMDAIKGSWSLFVVIWDSSWTFELTAWSECANR